MARRQSFDESAVRKLPITGKEYTKPDPDLVGHYIRVSAAGTKSYVAVTRHGGRQVWATLGNAEHLTLKEARARARTTIQRIKDGLPAKDEKPRAAIYRDVLADYLKRDVKARGLISGDEIAKTFERYIIPVWGKLDFENVRRAQVVALLDDVAANSGARTAELVLAYARRLANWYAVRNEDYVSPFVKGMAGSKKGEAKRKRILTDEEIKAVWEACSGPYGAMVKLALLTSQRREKVSAMRWSAIAENVWTVPSEDRQKGVGGELVLPTLATKVLDGLPKFEKSDFVFSEKGSGGGFSGFSRAHSRLLVASTTSDWVFHDLRRTARSLMSRANVSSDHAERVLGHVIDGVEGVYDRHTYRQEKTDALARLSDLVSIILAARDSNIVPMRGVR